MADSEQVYSDREADDGSDVRNFLPLAKCIGIRNCWEKLRTLVQEKADTSDDVNIETISEHLETKIQVAILDTGVDLKHSTFSLHQKNTKDGGLFKNFTEEENNKGALNDSNGHGTSCAAIVLGCKYTGHTRAEIDREERASFAACPAHGKFHSTCKVTREEFCNGVAPFADLIIGKVATDDGKCEPSCLAEGIRWAVNMDANIISISVSMEYSSDVTSAVYDALAKGKLVVCCASNEGKLDTSTILYPAKMGNVICVGSHNAHGQVSQFSSTGREVDVLGPGEDLWSAVPSRKPSENSYIRKLQGTSYAAPYVAGICALVLAFAELIGGSLLRDSVSNVVVMKAILRKMSSQPGNHEQSTGHGCLNPFSIFKFSKDRFRNIVNQICCSDEQVFRQRDRSEEISSLSVTPVFDLCHRLAIRTNSDIKTNQQLARKKLNSFYQSIAKYLSLEHVSELFNYMNDDESSEYHPAVLANTAITDFRWSLQDVDGNVEFPPFVPCVRLSAFFSYIFSKTSSIEMIIVRDAASLECMRNIWLDTRSGRCETAIGFLYISGSVHFSQLSCLRETLKSKEISKLCQRFRWKDGGYVVIETLIIESSVVNVFTHEREYGHMSIYVKQIKNLSQIPDAELTSAFKDQPGKKKILYFSEMDVDVQKRFKTLKLNIENRTVFSLCKELQKIKERCMNLYNSLILSHVQPMATALKASTESVVRILYSHVQPMATALKTSTESVVRTNISLSENGLECIDLRLPASVVEDYWMMKLNRQPLCSSAVLKVQKLIDVNESLELIRAVVSTNEQVKVQIRELWITGTFVKDIEAVVSSPLLQYCRVFDLGLDLDLFELMNWTQAIASCRRTSTPCPIEVRCRTIVVSNAFNLLESDTFNAMSQQDTNHMSNVVIKVTLAVDVMSIQWLDQPKETLKLQIVFLKKFLSTQLGMTNLQDLLRIPRRNKLKRILDNWREVKKFLDEVTCNPSGLNTSQNSNLDKISQICIQPSEGLHSYSPSTEPESRRFQDNEHLVIAVLHTACVTDTIVEEAKESKDLLPSILNRFFLANGLNPDVFISDNIANSIVQCPEFGTLPKIIHDHLGKKIGDRQLILVPVSSANKWDFQPGRVANAVDWLVSKRGATEQTTDSGHAADIIVLPFAFSQFSPRLYSSIANASRKGSIIIVPAVKNPKNKLMEMSYPGCYGDVLVIGSHDAKGNATVNTARGRELDFLMPGTCPEHSCILAAHLIASVLENAEAIGGLALRQAMSNNCVMREILRQHCSSRVLHDFANGYGELDITDLFTFNVEDLRRVVADATRPQEEP